MASIAILIPAFNVRDLLRNLLQKLISLHPESNIVVVDDGSSDDTHKTLSCEYRGGITFLRHEKNKGKGAAFRTGMNYILQNLDVDAVVFIDGDGQHKPEDIKRLLKAFVNKSGHFIIGRRSFSRNNMPWPRIVSNTLTSKLISFRLPVRIYDSQSGFRLIDINLLKKIVPFKAQGFDFETEILLKAGKLKARFCEVRISTIYAYEKSNIRPIRDILQFIRTYLTT